MNRLYQWTEEDEVNITVYLPDELGAKAKAAELPLSRLLRAAVEDELERRDTVEKTLSETQTYELEVLDEEDRPYTGRLKGKIIASDDTRTPVACEDPGFMARERRSTVYMTDDERVIVYDEDDGKIWPQEDPEEDLRSWLGPGAYAEAMHALGLKPVIDL